MSDKFSIRGMDPEGVADGDYVVTVSGGHVTGLTAAPAAGGGSGIVETIVPGSGIAVDSTDPANPVVSATGGGGGGGGGGVGRDRRWTIPTGVTSIDEFNDDSLNAAWVRVDNASTAAGQSWVEGADTVTAINTAPSGEGGGVYHALLCPIGTAMAVGDGFVTCFSTMSNYGSSYSMIAGIILADGTTFGAGSQVQGLHYFNQPSASALVALNAMSNFSAPSTLGSFGLGRPVTQNLYMRIVMTAANTWRLDVSPNGVAWIAAGSGARTLTPTHAGLTTSNASGAKALASFEFLRRVSGVT